jgi:hypothetical protein
MQTFQTYPIPEKVISFNYYKWSFHINFLKALEECHRKSPDFSFDSALTLFIQHLECMKSQGFKVNGSSVERYLSPADFCVDNRLLVLLRALYFVGTDLSVGLKSIPIWIIDGNYSRTTLQSLTNECIQVLFMSGVYLDAALDIYGPSLPKYTVLWEAARINLTETVKTLLQYGCNPNRLVQENRHKRLSTPLHVATHEGWAKIVKILIKYGADPSIKNGKGKTALDIAVKHKYKRIIRILNHLDKFVASH